MLESITQIISFAVAVFSVIIAITAFIVNMIKLRKLRKDYKNEMIQIYENKEAQRAEEEEMKITKCDRCGKEITGNVTEWEGLDLCADCAALMDRYDNVLKNLTTAKEEAYAAFIEAREKYVAADKALADEQRNIKAMRMDTSYPSTDPVGPKGPLAKV